MKYFLLSFVKGVVCHQQFSVFTNEEEYDVWLLFYSDSSFNLDKKMLCNLCIVLSVFLCCIETVPRLYVNENRRGFIDWLRKGFFFFVLVLVFVVLPNLPA